MDKEKSFPKLVVEDRKGKGWFEVKDIIKIYTEKRDVSKDSWRYEYMSGDASWILHLMTRRGILERKENPKWKGHYLYRVL